jgi:riboflavin kinase/FMN adenylyltransferase
VANFGFQPTIDETNRVPIFEVHILDELQEKIKDASELPGDSVFTVEFVDFIREERKFDSMEELKAQISKDCEIAREILQDPERR